MQKQIDNWYSSWFDTKYYHILYHDRDYDEARSFMDSLTEFLKLKPNAEILDLACGKGRHAKYLNKLGYSVTGVDLSPKSIRSAKKHENDNLNFEVHDMCLPYPKKFDAVFNLFTSFGYFETENDNLRTIKAIREELKPNGYAVIDFLNSKYIKENLVPKETKKVDGITFNIERYIENDYIYKTIKFEDSGETFSFVEKVKALSLVNFLDYFEKANLKLTHTFGDYKLSEFDENTSNRLILIFEK